MVVVHLEDTELRRPMSIIFHIDGVDGKLTANGKPHTRASRPTHAARNKYASLPESAGGRDWKSCCCSCCSLLSCQSGREKVVSSCVEASAVAILVVSLQQQQYVLSFSERGMLSGNGQVGVYCYVPSKVAQTRSCLCTAKRSPEYGVWSIDSTYLEYLNTESGKMFLQHNLPNRKIQQDSQRWFYHLLYKPAFPRWSHKTHTPFLKYRVYPMSSHSFPYQYPNTRPLVQRSNAANKSQKCYISMSEQIPSSRNRDS